MESLTAAKRWAAGLALLLSLAGCSDLLGPTQIGGPADPDAEMRPDLMVVEPAAAAPGDVIGLHFPSETNRGIHFVLERQAGTTWVHLFDLGSSANGGEPAWFSARTEGIGFGDVGIGGPGPDRVLIPPEAEPGTYRVCTGNAGDNFCAPVEVIDP